MATLHVTGIGVFSLAMITGAINTILGLIYGVLMALMAMRTFSIMGGFSTGLLSGVGIIIIMPIVYGIVGFIIGMISAIIFNVVTGFTGGLEIEVK
ncbi:hypothetical protein V7O62_03510 [Methanolobus sp. ZRKC2]|uniref:hypothetical protein n=1 Tax=Methanolobus sp. ZRKC2 TaxID=3125783 RepID=UPI00324BEC44